MARPAKESLAPSGQDHPLQSRLAYHLRCLAEDATDPDLSGVERLVLLQDRTKKIREIRHMLAATADSYRTSPNAHSARSVSRVTVCACRPAPPAL